MTLPHTAPGRGAAAAGLAGEAERATAGDPRPRAVHALAGQGARLLHCRQCWQRPGRPCTVSGPPGDHLARYQEAERRGLITRAELASVVGGLDVIAAHVIVMDVSR